MINLSHKAYKLLTVCLTSLSLSGCSSFRTYNEALEAALFEPLVWGNAGAAALVHLAGVDQKISDYASENTPIFGSIEDAKEASNGTRHMTNVSMNLGIIFTNEKAGNSIAEEKLKRLVGYNLTTATVAGSTTLVQEGFNRERPDGNFGSMPSGHTSRAFACSYLAHVAWRNGGFHPAIYYTTTALTYTSAYATAWARIEGKKHYPTDVLMGAAYGSFLTSFIYHLTRNFGLEDRLAVNVGVMKKDYQLGINLFL